MWKLSDLIGDQAEDEILSQQIDMKGMPIASPESLNWSFKKNPKRLVRVFGFGDTTAFNSFVVDVLEHQAETQHHGRITLQYPKVKIEVWTHSLNDVTEIDSEWATNVNEIYAGYNGQ